jgi:serine/threonine-protein kinase
MSVGANRCLTCGEALAGGATTHRCGELARTALDVGTTGRGGAALQPAPREDSTVGALLGGHYQVVSTLGAGGMGRVYLVEHTKLRKRFAAKVLRPDMAHQPDAIARFEIEAMSASKLDHDNIVNVIDFGRSEDGTVFLVMEHLQGETLARRLKRERMTPGLAARVLIQVCRGLGAAHQAGIVHRDMKPENVFLTRRSRNHCVIKLLDFGVSKIKESRLADARLTQTGQVLGSPLYMSPEAARGALDVDHRGDVYAVGVMLYEMLCGQPPFMASNYLQVLHSHIVDTPPPPRELEPALAPVFEHILERALAKNRERRYQTMAELEADLVVAIPDLDPDAPLVLDFSGAPVLDIGLNTPTVPMRTPTPTPTTTPTLTSLGAAPVPPQRSRLGVVSVAGAAALALAAAILVVRLWPSSPPDRTAGPAATGGLAAPEARPVTADAQSTTPTPRRVALAVGTKPPRAKIFLDGNAVGETPIVLRVAASDTPHEVRVERAGYEPATRTLLVTEDQAVFLPLRRVRQPAPASPPLAPPIREER